MIARKSVLELLLFNKLLSPGAISLIFLVPQPFSLPLSSSFHLNRFFSVKRNFQHTHMELFTLALLRPTHVSLSPLAHPLLRYYPHQSTSF